MTPEALAEVLAAHWQVSPAGRCFSSVTENCGWESQHPSPLTIEEQFRAHLASVLADHFAEAVTEARARELREAADEMHFGVARSAMITERAECHKKQCSCGHPSEDRLLALVGDRFRDWLRARADSLAPEAPSEAE